MSCTATTSPACRSPRTAAWSAFSPTATCVSRSAWTARSSEVMTKENLITGRRDRPRGGQGDPARQSHREAAHRRRPGPSQGPDHRQGHPEGGAVPQRVQGRVRPSARRRRRSVPGTTAMERVEAAGAGRGRRDRHRHRPRPLRRRSSRPSSEIKATYPTMRGDRRQRRHHRRRPSAGARRRRRHQGRHGPGVDLHHPRRLRRRRAAAHGHRRLRASVADDYGIPVIADGGIKYLRRHHQGPRRRGPLGDDRRPVRRHRGEPGRDHSLPGPHVQALPRHGLARGDARTRGQPQPLHAGRRAGADEAGSRGHRGARAAQGAARRSSCTSWSAACRRAWATAVAAPSPSCTRTPASCASPTPRCRRATCTTCSSPRKRRTIEGNSCMSTLSTP